MADWSFEDWRNEVGIDFADGISKRLSRLLRSRQKRSFIRVLFGIMFDTAEMISRTAEEMYPEKEQVFLGWWFRFQEIAEEFRQIVRW